MADFRDLILATAPQPSPASSTYAAPFQMPTQEDLARRQEQQDKETLSQEYRNYERQYDDYLRANSSNIGAFTPLGKLSIDDWVKYRNNEYDSTMPLPKHMFFTPDMRKQLSEKPLIQAGAGEELGTRIAKASDGLTQGVRDWIHAITGIGYSREEQDKERVYRTQGNIEEKNRLERIKADLEAGKPLEDDDLEFLNEHDKPFLAQIWQGIKDTPEFAKELATNPEAMDMFVDESIRQLPAGVGLMAATKNPLAAVGNYAKTLSRIAGLKRNAQRAAKASKIKEAAKDAALATGSGGITEIAHGMGERSQESPAYTMAQNALLDGLVPLAASQIGKGMGRRIAGDGNKSGTEAETAEDPRFSLIGERGAEFSDFNNNTTEKKDKLITAKEMEASGKNASQIYYATGWEKGADGKWKYELPDLELKDRTFELFKSEHGIDIIKSRGLDELIDADELFRAHPDLRDIDVFYDRYGSGGSSYSDKTNTIRIGIPPNELTPDGIRKTLIHEIQHAIQHREGFASGGSPGEFRGEYDKLMNEIKQKNESMRIANNQGDSKLYDRLMSERNELTKKTLELQDEYGIVGYNQYRRLAGEVEARNVAKRSGISENVRDMIPFRQTEDVPRNEQIVRFHAASEAGISESHDTPAIREAARKAWREKGTDSPFFKRWFGDSKVVDEQGKPLVVYHGTNAEFTEFKNKNKYQNIQHEGYFFGDKETAGMFGNGELMPVYLNIDNPYIIDVAHEIREYGDEYPETLIQKWEGKTRDDFETGRSAVAYFDDNIAEIYDRAKEDGSNGIIVYGTDGSINIIAFEPTQIKSATDNAGTFDGSNPDIRYMALNQDFAKELDAWDGKTDKTFNVGTTSEPLQSIGVKDRGIIWHSRKIGEILNKHKGMTKDIIKQVPNILENPIVVLKSNTGNSRLSIFGEVYDKNNAPVTAILELMPTDKGMQPIDLNIIASAYGKDSNPAKFISKSDVLYITEDKDKADAWFQGLGLQLPSDKTKLGSIGNIEYSKNGIYIKGVPFSQLSEDASAPTEKPQISTQQTTTKPIPQADFNKLLDKLNKTGLAVEVITDPDKIQAEISKQFATPKGEIYGFATQDGRIFLDPDKMNANTPIHEYGHLWIDFVKQNNKGLYNEIARLAIQTDEFQQLGSSPHYGKLTDQQRAEEVMAAIIGNNGETAFHNAPQGLQARLKQLLAELWEWIKEQFGHSSNIRNLAPEQMRNVTFERLMEAATKDITAGRRIKQAETPSNELDFNLWRHTMTDQEEPTGGEQVDNAVPANAESQTPETKVDDDALFGDDPDKVREQLKNVSHDKPLTRQEKKEEKLKERLGNEYAPPTDRVLKKELGLTSADIKKLQEESLKHKETAEDKNASEAERAIAKYKAELSEKEADAKYRQYLEELRTEFSEYQDKNPEFKAQSEFYSSKLNALEHTHDIQRAMMDRPDRIQLMQALYKAFDYTDEKTNVNNWEAFARLKPEQQIEQLNTFLSMTANTAQRRVKPAAPNVPANIPQPGNGIPAASNGKYDMNNADDVREYLASQRRRGLA